MPIENSWRHHRKDGAEQTIHEKEDQWLKRNVHHIVIAAMDHTRSSTIQAGALVMERTTDNDALSAKGFR